MLVRIAPRFPTPRNYGTRALGGGKPIIYIPPGSNIYAFGSPAHSRTPLVREVDWTVQEGEAWAVVSGTGGGGKGAIFKTLLGHTRIAPPTPETQRHWAESGGLYPFFSTLVGDPYTQIAHVSFRQRSGAESGAFFDYTARYGAVWETEDRVTLRDTLLSVDSDMPAEKHALFDELTRKMNLTSLLDLPLLTLSNGQTRRARVVKAILNSPELLLLDEPLTGLDPTSRQSLNEVLHRTHPDSSPRIIVGLRKGEEIPPWITHVLEIQDGAAFQRQPSHFPAPHALQQLSQAKSQIQALKSGELLVDMKNVNVSYGDRKVLHDINWEIRQGERWHLQGANGSGKTTLLALLTGDHPQSYVQRHLHLPSSSTSGAPLLRPRKATPTAHLRRLIGVVSPEMFDAFPRRHPGMSVWEAVTTGFDGGFVPRTRNAPLELQNGSGVGWVDVSDEEVDLVAAQGREIGRAGLRAWRTQRCWEVMNALGPAAWAPSTTTSTSQQTQAFAALPFSSLSPGEQRLVLLMRALVGRPPVILLDEAWSGMDDTMIAAARRYLRGEDGLAGVDEMQAVVVITHWEDEVPWRGHEVMKFKLGLVT